MATDNAGERADERIARWVREHGRAVRGYLLGLVRRVDVADDLLQEVFRRAWQATSRYRDNGHERAYLLRIADRLVVDRSRRQRREVNLDSTNWQEIEPAAVGSLPLDEMSDGETRDELAAALAQLSFGQRRVLLLRYYGDLTFEEIAEALDCPLGTALSHCRRGLEALRKQLTAKI